MGKRTQGKGSAPRLGGKQDLYADGWEIAYGKSGKARKRRAENAALMISALALIAVVAASMCGCMV